MPGNLRFPRHPLPSRHQGHRVEENGAGAEKAGRIEMTSSIVRDGRATLRHVPKHSGRINDIRDAQSPGLHFRGARIGHAEFTL